MPKRPPDNARVLRLPAIRPLIAESAALWGLPKTIAIALFWLPLAGGAAVALARLDKPLYRWILREDGVVEWAQFLGFAVAAVAAGGVAGQRFRAGHPWQASLFAAMMVALIFVAGEEIAWGQRLLALEPPALLRDINKQRELTLHNIGPTLEVFHMVMLAGGAFGATAYVVNKRLRLERYWDQAQHLLVPPFFLATSFLFVFAYQLFRHTVWRRSGFTISYYAEWSEFCLALGVSVFLVMGYRRLAAQSRGRATLAQTFHHESSDT